ncbi:long-chain acyl-CoA synthetase [Bacillus pakistanensis]|uniref:Long-chain acyl-CoA synthetase n=1 Tax=Rossellomorea pakistanensis TaxID=992288 RepID=A0ABS2NEW3_9BACI|nr:AMP-binding protein [Bacillus pakistanensis]MBM7586394.1 long-chain acyl-CoA synthetase [Bacillus pakistanensis]
MFIGDHLETFSIEQNEKPAIVSKEKVITYGEFTRIVITLQKKLYSIAKKGKKVALLMDDDTNFLHLFFAIIRNGCIAVPLDPKWTKNERDHALTISKPDLLITSHNIEHSEALSVINFDQLTRQQERNEDIKPFLTLDNLFYIGFTSGSSGKPKGFIRNHRSWLESFNVYENVFDLNSTQSMISPGPLCHSLSLFTSVHTIHMGATLYVSPQFDPIDLYRWMTEEKVDVFVGVPTMVEGITRSNQSNINTRVKRMIVSGAGWPQNSITHAKNMFPMAQLYEYYGASELSFVSYKELTKEVSGSSKLFPNVNVSILNEKRMNCKEGQVGEVFVNSPMLFTGYINNDEETRKVLSEFGATVGDIGCLEENGNLTLVGRSSNMLKSGGLKIYPEEIESVLKGMDEINEVVVIGVEDDYWGEKVVALIEWKNQDQRKTVEEIKNYCQTHLSSYKCPKQFISRESFHYTKSGKIDRQAIRREMEEDT